MLGVYLSGTGNTQHCIEKLATLIDENAIVMPLESENIVDVIKNNEIIILGYPTQFSNAPIMVRDFIKDNDIWKNKKILCVTTMGAFSGDGAGCTARLLKKKGAIILGGLHIRMPDSVCDSKLLKKSLEKNKKIVMNADRKIEKIAQNIKINNKKAVAENKCTMCYRCISHCPQKAITLIGNTVQEQCQFSKYIS